MKPSSPASKLLTADSFQVVWLKYLNKTVNNSVISESDKTPFDFFFSANPLEVPDQKILKASLDSAKNPSEFTSIIESSFKLRSIKILEFCNLIQIANDKNSELIDQETQQKMITYSFWSIISSVFRIKASVTSLTKDSVKDGEVLTADEWKCLHDPIEFLFKCDEATVCDLVASLQPYISAMNNHRLFLTLSCDHPILISLQKLITLLSHSLMPIVDNMGWFCIDFLTSFLFTWISHTTAEMSNLFLLSMDIYMKALLNVIEKLPAQQLRRLVLAIAAIMSRSETNNDNHPLLCSSLSLISFSADTLDQEVIQIASRTLSRFYQISSARLPPEISEEVFRASELAKYNNYDDYLSQNESISIEPIYSSFLEDVNIMSPIFVNLFSKYHPEFFDIVYEIFEKMDNESFMMASSVFLLSTARSDLFPDSPSFWQFVEKCIRCQKFDGIPKKGIELIHKRSLLRFMYFLSVKSSNNIERLLNMISPVLSTTIEILPYFRSILKDNSCFDIFIKSKMIITLRSLIKKDTFLDSLAEFIQVVAISNQILVFQSTQFSQIVGELLMNNRYSEFIIPVFILNDQTSLVFPNVFKQISFVFMKAKGDQALYSVCDRLLVILKDSVQFLLKPNINDFVEQAVLSSSFLPLVSKSNIIMERVLDLVLQLVLAFPQYHKKLVSDESQVFKNIESSLCNYIGDENIAFLLLSLALRKRVTSFSNEEDQYISSDYAIMLTHKFLINTPLEKTFIEFLNFLCTSSISNAFECFQAGIIGSILLQLSIQSLVDCIVTLFRTIGSVFFSPVCLRQTFTALRAYDSQDLTPQQVLLDSFSGMISESTKAPVDCFFHFGGVSSGIFGPQFDSTVLTSGWSFSTIFRTEKSSGPLFAIQESNSNFVFITFKNSQIVFERNSSSYTFDVGIKLRTWHNVIFTHGPKGISLMFDGKLIGSQKVDKSEFSNSAILRLANCKGECFFGDIGPTFVYNTDDISTITSNKTGGRPKSALCCYDPTSANGSTISNVIVGSEPASIVGTPVPFCTSVNDIIQLPGTFGQLLSLFELPSKPGRNSEQILHSLVIMMQLLFGLSPEMELQFEKIGGFVLLSGLLLHTHPSCFTSSIIGDFVSLFESIQKKELRKQMVVFIWLNFELVSKFSFAIQKAFYSQSLLRAIEFDSESFKFESFEFLLYQIQIPISKPGINIITSEEEVLINKIQWDLFKKICPKPDYELVTHIFDIFFFNENHYYRLQACEVLKRVFYEDPDIASQILKMTGGISVFGKQLQTHLEEFRLSVLQLLFLIRNFELMHNEKPSSLNGVASLSCQASDEFINRTLLFVYGLEKVSTNMERFSKSQSPIMWPDFIPIVLANSNESTYPCIATKICNSIESSPDSIYPFLNDITWIIWAFLAPSNSIDFTSNPDEFISLLCSFILVDLKRGSINGIRNSFHFLIGLSYPKVFECLLTKLIPLLVGSKIDVSVLSQVVEIAILFEMYFPIDNRVYDFKQAKDDIMRRIRFCDFKGYPLVYSPPKSGLTKQIIQILLTIVQSNPSIMVTLSSKYTYSALHMLLYLTYLQATQLTQESLELYTQVQASVFSNNIISAELLKPLSMYLIASMTLLSEAGLSPPPLPHQNFSKDESIVLSTLFSANFRHELSSIENQVSSKIKAFAEILTKSLVESSQYVESQDINQRSKVLEAFIKESNETRGITTRQNFKLAQAFIREAKSGKKDDKKWMLSKRLDSIMRPIFMKENPDFDDHAKASQQRDFSISGAKADNDSINFKKILDQSSVLGISQMSSNDSKNSYSSKLITSTSVFQGIIKLIESKFVFEGIKIMEGFGIQVPTNESRSQKIIEFTISNIEFVFLRKYLYDDIACEVYTKDQKSYFLVFDSPIIKNSYMNRIKIMTTSKNVSAKDPKAQFSFFASLRSVCNSSVQTMGSQELLEKSKLVQKWQSSQVSNYEYILYINILAGRSFNLLSHYPVFPWVLSDYSSSSINLNDPISYRDFSLPLGAMNLSRLSYLQENQREMNVQYENCLYRTHFSSAGSVIGFLIRMEPFTSLHIALQGGQFDYPDRIFNSIEQTWASVIGLDADFRELTPEFYSNHHFLSNENVFNLGVTSKGEKINDIKLPPWASSPADFVYKMRLSLESSYTSAHIHQWMDLMFGTLRKSVERNNLWHPFSYEEIASSQEVRRDESNWKFAKYHCANFGACPSQLFTSLHPKKDTQAPFTPIPLPKDLKIEGKILFFGGRTAISTNAILYNFTTQSVVQSKVNIIVDRFKSINYVQANGLLCIVPASAAFCAVLKQSKDNSFAEVTRFSNRGQSISAVCVLADKYVFCGSVDGTIGVWNQLDLKQIGSITYHTRPVISISADYTLGIVVSVDSEQLIITRLPNLKHLDTLQLSTKPTFVQVLPTGIIAMTSDVPGGSTLTFMDLCGTKLSSHSFNNQITQIKSASCQDGRAYIVTLSNNGKLTVFESGSCSIIQSFDDASIEQFYDIEAQTKTIFAATASSNIVSFRF